MLTALSSVVAVIALPFFVEPGGARAAGSHPAPVTQTAPASAPPDVGSQAVDQAAADAVVPEAVVEQPADAVPAPTLAATDPCADALAWVAAAGLSLPATAGYHCPSTEFPHHGAACWDSPACAGARFIAINMDLLAGTTTGYLRHVVAHEVCHMLDFQATGASTESGADACAAAHGAPA
jgi:hypothetical protein